MSRKLLLKKAYEKMDELSEWRLREVHDFVIFLSSMKEEEELTKDLTYLNENSESFDFLNEEEDLYSDSDIIEEGKKEILFFFCHFFRIAPALVCLVYEDFSNIIHSKEIILVT